MSKPTCYLILATPRSGSTLLGQGLQASGLAGDPKEFFGHKMFFWMERWRTPTLSAYAACLRQVRATPNGVFGAKLLYRQLLHLESLARREPELADLPLPELLDRLFPDTHLVWVSREDKVRQAISWFKARHTGVWGQDQRQSAPKLGRAWRIRDKPSQPGELAFDYDGIAALVRQAETEDAAISQFFTTYGIEPFRVLYEQFSPRYEETIFTLLRWLNITPPPNLALPDQRTVKLADDRTDEWVACFRELQTAGVAG